MSYVESGCSALDAAEPLTRGQQGKQSLMGVGGFFDARLSPGMEGSAVPTIPSTVLTTLSTHFQSEALPAPNQTEMQLVSILSVAPM